MRRQVPLPLSSTFDRLAAQTASTAQLARFIKADVRNRLKWRKQSSFRLNHIDIALLTEA